MRAIQEGAAMTTEIRTIEVKAYRCRDGEPTCSNQNKCQHLAFRSSCADFTCDATGQKVERDMDRLGYLRPVDGCPVWKGEE